MAVFNNMPGSAGTVELIDHAAGSNQSKTCTFSKNYHCVIIVTGGYSGASITSGSGWTADYSDGGSSANSGNGWHKYNVASGESVTVKCNNRYGIGFYGIN